MGSRSGDPCRVRFLSFLFPPFLSLLTYFSHSCATYLFSTPPVPHGSHATATVSGNGNSDVYNGLAGTFCLVAYLFFDGLVSTTQERVFGKVRRALSLTFLNLN
jgi:hypothetical protein